MSPMDFDRRMMANALRVGRRGLGRTAPNPSVGAVIADAATGEVIARGWTQPGGRPHAETEAIGRAGPRARGATMYVTLEPCAHQGKTPPCADAIVAAGLGRVVVGALDPDPRTAGQGVARLRRAGIEVTTDCCHAEARWLALGHILRQTAGRPFVQIKMALAGDGSVARGRDGKPAWVTGALARARGHLLRAEADAILVGARTVADDDPALTCRLPGLEARSPIRIVLASDLDLAASTTLVKTAREVPVWAVTAPDAPRQRSEALTGLGVEVVPVAAAGDGLAVAAVLGELARRGVTRLLVEGGPRTWRSFALSGTVDEVVMFVAPARGRPERGDAAGGDRPPPARLLAGLLPGLAVTLAQSRRIGDDEMHVFHRHDMMA